MGVVVASLIVAYMSTMASHFNWGSSYVVNDFFINPDAPEKKLVLVGHVSTVPGGRCRSLASERSSGFSHVASNRCGHRVDFYPAMVLVAH